MDPSDIVWGGTEDHEMPSSSTAVTVEKPVPRGVVAMGRRTVSGELEDWIQGRVETRLTEVVESFRAGARDAGVAEKAERVEINPDDITVSITGEDPQSASEQPGEQLLPLTESIHRLPVDSDIIDSVSSLSGYATLHIEIAGASGRHLEQVNQSLAAGSDTDAEDQAVRAALELLTADFCPPRD